MVTLSNFSGVEILDSALQTALWGGLGAIGGTALVKGSFYALRCCKLWKLALTVESKTSRLIPLLAAFASVGVTADVSNEGTSLLATGILATLLGFASTDLVISRIPGGWSLIRYEAQAASCAAPIVTGLLADLYSPKIGLLAAVCAGIGEKCAWPLHTYRRVCDLQKISHLNPPIKIIYGQGGVREELL